MQFKKKLLVAAFLICITFSLMAQKTSLRDKAIREITETEAAFEKMAAQNGLAEAFSFYADEKAVIKRNNDTLVKEKQGIRNFYSKEIFARASIKWSPDFVDAAESGDMGYTYGKYIWQLKRSDGKMEESRGVFHTIWKKKKSGTWKFVWD